MVLAEAGRDYVGDPPDYRSSDYWTSSATADFWAGFITGMASLIAGGIGVIVIPVVIIALRNRYGQLCRGLLFGGVLTAILMLAYWWFFGAGLHVKL